MSNLPTDPLAYQKAMRLRLRAAIRHDPVLMAWEGFRIPRKERAPVDPSLRRATDIDRKQAAGMRDLGMSEHAVEQKFASWGIRMTRNRQSQDCGANP